MLRFNNAPQRNYIGTLTKKFLETAIHWNNDDTTAITALVFPGIKRVMAVNYRAWIIENHIEIACLLTQNPDQSHWSMKESNRQVS